MADFRSWFAGGKRKSDGAEDQAPEGTIREKITFFGRVQGVGFRYRAVYAARDLGCTGWVENEPDGTVDMEAQGTPEAIDALIREISSGNWIEVTNTLRERIPVLPAERDFRVRGY
ncbi:MAG: acylphosphatase [Lachnospiraceae bacterium]